MKKKKTLEQEIISRLKKFSKDLEDGIPIEATRIERVQTPDGPMHLRKHIVLVPKRKERLVKENPSDETAMEILDKLVGVEIISWTGNDEPSVMIQDVKKRIKDFVAEMERKHEPLTGEAYPEDKTRYCAVCMASDGGSSRYPCPTIRAVRKFLCPKK